MEKKGKIAIGILTTIGAGVGLYFLGKKLGWWAKSSYDNTNILDNNTTSTSNTETSSQKGCGGNYTNTTFPLQKGSCGNNVVILQKYLGITSDGKFGNNTEKAVKNNQNYVSSTPIGFSAGYNKVSENDFKQIK
tara:strand:- start:488 stop:889 length:402 start_codon:yes stop_codon:yes gene_type:complete